VVAAAAARMVIVTILDHLVVITGNKKNRETLLQSCEKRLLGLCLSVRPSA
jgi:hypothetical protein